MPLRTRAACPPGPVPTPARLALLCAVTLAGMVSPAPAQLDPSGEWRTLHTARFRVHFRPAYREVARHAAREAERAWTLLARELRPPRGTIDLTLADDVDAANGFASVLPSNRLTVYLAPPTTDVGLHAYDDWMRLVIVHELAHLFHLDRARGLWRGLQAVFGRAPGLFPNAYQPSWVTEGIATAYESRFTGAGRAEGSFHTQLLGAASHDNAARSPWDALPFTRWPAGHVPYAYGGRFFSRAGRGAGDSLMPRFVEATAGQWIPVRVGRPLGRAGGGVLAETWRAATAARPAANADTGRVLARGLRTAPVPRVAPDGQRIAWLHDDGRGAPRLRIGTAEQPRRGPSHRVTADVRYDWLGDTLIVSQLEFTDRRHIRADLYHWAPAGRWRRVSRGARLTEPRTGGGRLAAVALRPGGAGGLVGSWRNTRADWGAIAPSPDGRWIAAARHAAGRWTLVRWAVDDDAAVEVLLDAGGVVSDPTWGPGGAILFVWDGAGVPQVHRYDTDGSLARVTSDPHGARAPALLPDGSLLYTTLRADGWQLRRTMPVAHAVALPAPPAPFDSAPPIAVRESGYALWPALRPHFWIPLLSDAGAAGRFGGAYTEGVDAVGRFAYAARLLVGIRGRVAAGAALQSDAWANPTLDAGLASDWDGVGRTSSGVAVSLLEQTAAVGATFVTRRWRTRASVRLALEYERDRFVAVPDTALADICTGCDDRDRAGAAVTLGVAHAVTPALGISTQDGLSWSVTARRLERQGGPGWVNEYRSRLALYLQLPGGGFAPPVLAARITGGVAEGPEAGLFDVGGGSAGGLPLAAGHGLGTRRSFPVRGYDPGAVAGRRAVAAAVELRVPLALVGRAIGHLPLGVDRLSAVAFADAGDAWNAGALPTPPRLRALGAELVGDLTFPYDYPIRVRGGVAFPLAAAPGRGTRAARVYALLGSDF